MVNKILAVLVIIIVLIVGLLAGYLIGSNSSKVSGEDFFSPDYLCKLNKGVKDKEDLVGSLDRLLNTYESKLAELGQEAAHDLGIKGEGEYYNAELESWCRNNGYPLR